MKHIRGSQPPVVSDLTALTAAQLDEEHARFRGVEDILTSDATMRWNAVAEHEIKSLVAILAEIKRRASPIHTSGC
jgi:hypothetical protein